VTGVITEDAGIMHFATKQKKAGDASTRHDVDAVANVAEGFFSLNVENDKDSKPTASVRDEDTDTQSTNKLLPIHLLWMTYVPLLCGHQENRHWTLPAWAIPNLGSRWFVDVCRKLFL